MKTTIKNRGGESTLTIKGDFYQILDENFTEICQAIANKIKILKELKALLDTDEQVFDTIVHITRKSISPEAAAIKLQEELSLSEMAAKYLMDYPLFDLGSLNSEYIRKKLSKIQKQIAMINILF